MLKYLSVRVSNRHYLKVAVFLCLAFVLHNRWVVPRISFDQMRQLVAVENIVDGHGVSFQFIGDDSKNIKRDNSFPMGYYIVMTPAYLVFHDALLLHRIFELVGLVLLVYQLYLFGNWIEQKYKLKHFVWIALFFSVIQLNPWRAMGFTDIWSLLFFVASIRLAVTWKDLSIARLLLVGILSYMTVSMRYAYYPLAFIPILLILVHYTPRRWKGYIPLMVLVLLIGATAVFNHFYFRDMDHLDTAFNQSRWFFGNIKQMDPVGINAFFSDHVIFGALNQKRWGIGTNWALKYGFLAVSCIVFLYLLIISIKVFKINLKNILYKENILPIGIWGTIFISVGFISALSIYFPTMQEHFLYTWQLISRYYAPAYIMLQFLLIFLLMKETKRIRKTILSGIVLASLLFQVAYFSSFFYRFSPVDVWGNYVQFYGREEMPEVMEQYSKLVQDPSIDLSIPESQLKYEYLSIYYLTGPDRLTDYLAKKWPDYPALQTRMDD